MTHNELDGLGPPKRRLKLLAGVTAMVCLILGDGGMVTAAVMILTGGGHGWLPLFGIGGVGLVVLYYAITHWLRWQLRKRDADA